jgi:hypothetical protein
MIRLTIICCLLAAPLQAADITIESAVKGNIATLTAKTEAKNVVWIPVPGLDDVVRPELLIDGKTRVVSGKTGAYRVIAIGAIGEKPIWAETVVTFGTPEPPLPDPKPTPPVDDLQRRLRDAYANDGSPGKRGQLVNLHGIYAAMADHAANDQSITTSRILLEVLTKVREGMLVDGVLIDMRRIIAAEIAATIGSPSDAPLDRERAAGLFKRIVSSLPRPE